MTPDAFVPPLWTAAVALGVVAFVVSIGLTEALIRLAPRLGLMDLPSARKVHTTPTPRGGGIAVVAAVVAAALYHLLFIREYSSPLQTTLLALPVAVLGLLDDLRPLSWRLRLGVQLLAAAAAAPIAAPHLSPWLWPLALVWIVGLTNAFNMLDNMDALSGGVAALTALALAAAGQTLFGVTLAAALLGFLAFNRPPARIFLGDVGSMFLGFSLALGGLRLLPIDGGVPWLWLAPLCVFATPCYDLTAVVLLRLSQGRSPFQPDKQHLSHRLAERGLSKPAAVGVIYLLTLASAAAGLALFVVDSWTAAALVLALPALEWGGLAVFEFGKKREVVS